MKVIEHYIEVWIRFKVFDIFVYLILLIITYFWRYGQLNGSQVNTGGLWVSAFDFKICEFHRYNFTNILSLKTVAFQILLFGSKQ